MKKASELCIFEVCRDATSVKDPRVYRRDIVGFRAPDATLIAAAPELAEALIAVVELAREFHADLLGPDFYRIPIDDDQRISTAISALRKAGMEGV